MVNATLADHSRAPSGPISSMMLMKGSNQWRLLGDARRELFGDVRKFAQDQLAPIATALDKGEVSLNDVKGLKDFRAFGVPEKYGGYEGHDGIIDAVITHQCLAYGSPSAASERDGNGLFIDPILLAGTEEQKQAHVPKIVSGEFTGCFGLTDPHCGSDIGGMTTLHFEEKNGVYILNGQKTFVTNGPIATHTVVFANDVKNPTKFRNLTAFVVPRKTDSTHGFTSGPHFDKMSWRGSETSEIFFDDVPLTAENVLGKVGSAIGIIVTTLDYGRLKIAAGALGIMERIYDEVVLKFAQDRPSHTGGMLKNAPLFQAQLTNVAMTIEATRGMIYDAAFLAESRNSEGKIPPFGDSATRAKIFATESLQNVAKWGVNSLGGSGVMYEYVLSTMFLNAAVYTIVEGATNPLLISQGARLVGGE